MIHKEDNFSKQLGLIELKLSNFRSYKSLDFTCDTNSLVFIGSNGVGKTNLLEAISFLTPGLGLRQAKLNDVGNDGYENWVVTAVLDDLNEQYRIGTGVISNDSLQKNRRIVRINGESMSKQSVLNEYINVTWLTPSMDGLFNGPSSERRRFLDNLVFGFDKEHSSRINRYKHALKERMRLLKLGNKNISWLLALEEQIASEGVAISATRSEIVSIINEASDCSLGVFPRAELVLLGVVNDWLKEMSALDTEEKLKDILEKNRNKDLELGYTSEGPHRTDLLALFKDKNMPAAKCSTGEQKALLLSIIMSVARVKKLKKDVPSLLLLDEVIAHLDVKRRDALFKEIIELKIQAWMTGTDYDMFHSIKNYAQFFYINNSQIRKLENE